MTLNLLRVKILFYLLLFTTTLYTQGVENDAIKPLYNSLLWEITGMGMDQPSYLYGTMHVSQKLAFHLGEPFFEAIESCDMVALELNPETWMKDLAKTDLHQEAYSENSFYNNFYEDAFKFPVPKNRDIAYHIAAEDNLINGLLYRSSSYAVDFEEETYLDLYIFQTGKRMGKEIFSLENYTEVMDFSRKAMKPNVDDEEINYRKFNDLFKDISPQEVLQDSYRKGDLNLVDSISKLMNPSKNFHKYMIVERNKGMAVNMDSIMQAGTSLFTGVGAAHLPGDYGVINLLRKEGYTIRPIEKGVGGKSKIYQDKYDDVVVPFKYETQSLAEGMYTLDVPGTLYTMPSMGNFITYLHPNMPNGAYYWVKRIKSHDLLMGRNLDFTMGRIDSMLYENIPGEIISKKKIEEQGYKGYDIVNKTRQGDMQRYHIYATPLEILIFKMGGTKKFAIDHGEQFFSSIAINIPKDLAEFEVVSPEEGGFSVDMPMYNLMFRLRNGMSSGGPGLEYQGMDDKGDFYLLRKTVMNDPVYIEEDKFELKQFVKSIAKDALLDRSMTQLTTFNGYPSVNATYDVLGNNKDLHVKIVIKGNEYFYLAKLSSSKYEAANSFFETLKFTDVQYQNDFEELVDSTLGFKTETVKISEASKLLRKTQQMYFQSVDADEDDFSFLLKNRKITSSNTGEEVSVTLKRFNAFQHDDNIDSIWNREMHDMGVNSSMVIHNVKKYKEDSLFVLDLLLVDTGSTRGIKVKKILSNRRLYTLRASIDTLSVSGKFIESTYSNFKLLPDSICQLSLFESKNDLFFEYLESGDSLKTARSFEFINLIRLESKDESRLLALINNFDIEYHGMAERAELIKLLRDLKTKSSINFLENEYLINEDTVTYQLACLSALSSMGTQDSRKVLMELMVNNPTIPSENSDMNAIYTPLFDSLEISKVLFPEFMELSSFPEYKKNNLNLLSSLIQGNHIKPRVMKKYKRRLINEGLIELKRQFASEEGWKEKSNSNWNTRNKMTRLNFDLLDYAIILSPWYDKEDKVKKFYNDTQRMKNKKTLTRLVCLMELRGVPVKESTWESLASEADSRSFLFKNMRKYGVEHEFDQNYFKQDKLSFSQLVSQYKFEDAENDIEFVEKVLIESKEDPGYYYFYKAKRKGYYEDEFKWAIYYNGPQPSDETLVNSEPKVNAKSENIKPSEDYQDLLEEIKLKLEMKGRKRFSRDGYSDEHDGLGF
ncbi:MAG: hypothetical protein ACI81Y_001687 [Glaciecola sp.]|jgi:uncharacterized protein YbaP (TraB family)